MKRIYDNIIKEQIATDDEMIFLSGPRQVGKTSVSLHAKQLTSQFVYLNWDNEDHRQVLLAGPKAVSQFAKLGTLSSSKPIIAFDEIHKQHNWKNFLKGFYDVYGKKTHIIVTGSARLDIYKRGGDSLMGRYFPYRMHPFSVAECVRTSLHKEEIYAPTPIEDDDYLALLKFGGFPKPFIKRDPAFHQRWHNLRQQQLFREDIRDLNAIHDLHRLEILSQLLQQQASSQLTYSKLATHIKVSVDTITRWLDILETFYYCFRIRPWSKNISRSLIKEPKVYLWDWSMIKDPGAKAENFVASHLLKAVQFWQDRGLGHYGLYYLRDTNKREVDFIVTKNEEPWFLVEVKQNSNHSINPNLHYFQEQSGAKHAFQAVINMPFVDANCFNHTAPTVVPARTLLSQLI